MYDQEFKEKVLEDFKTNPYYKTIARKYLIGRNILRYWITQAGINGL